MPVLYIFGILCSIYPTAMSSTGLSCLESLPTVSYVLKCPSNETDWRLAAKKKGCHNLSKVQNCTSAEKFVYHCVLNKEATMLLEVCAPVWYMSGYCARFSTEDQRIVNEPGLDCTQFVQSCPSRFMSNESYKYQSCYRSIEDKKEVLNSVHCKKNDYSIIVVFLVVAIIAVVFLLLFILYDKKWKRCRNPKVIRGNEESEISEKLMNYSGEEKEDVEKNSQKNEEKDKDMVKSYDETKETVEDDRNEDDKINDDENGVDSITIERPEISRDDDEEIMKFETMTGKTGTCSVKSVKDISMLREKLSEKLQFPKEIIWVVVKEDGIIYNDETGFENLKKHQDIIQVVIGNNKRIVHDACHDSSVETDIISNKPVTTRKCKMRCNHFTAPETLFDYTKDALTKGEAAVLCPKCNEKWEMTELIQKCDMSMDEKLFLEHQMSLNLMTKMQFQTSVRLNKSKPDFS
ncbi:uncharacterized protein LOC133178475 [Saccostrea echinata]|uniref:uncharacterized protein LOC133178475 n=1 Tax=Saccostrea echinata TaxID=191078 RepID=UPI002A81B209|nr:uncharacterized protein LOC133178475 [Saccostrea echinata]